MIHSFLLLLYVSILWSDVVHSQTTNLNNNNRCNTPRNTPGICINIKQCPSMLNLLETGYRDQKVKEYLRSSACGYDKKTPKVCCPGGSEVTQNQNQPLTGQRRPSSTSTSSSTTSRNRPQPQSFNQPSTSRSQPQCGQQARTENKIVGGQESTLGAWPWIAAIGYRSTLDPGPQWNCAGSLINPRFILTAAHCFAQTGWTAYMIRLGDLNLNEEEPDGATPTDIPIERTITHPSYSVTGVSNDIALVKMRRSAQYTDLIRPICLPNFSNLRTRSLVDEDVFVAGWGRTSFNGPRSDALKDLRIPIQHNDVCKRAYANKQGAHVDDNVICAGVLTGGMDSCAGDSGGPLMYLTNSSFYLVGIVSYGYKCAEIGHPGIYTRVTKYLDWVNKNSIA